MPQYDISYTPPRPIIFLSISPVNDPTNSVVFAALVDSGSDITIIPQRVALQLGLQFFYTRKIGGIGTDPNDYLAYPVYSAHVRVEGLFDDIIPVVAMADEELVGRDVLRKFTVVLDGPGSFLTGLVG